eukprot:COSAG01_NODE_4609_length_4882_cov_2.470834_6_plen_122_part_00
MGCSDTQGGGVIVTRALAVSCHTRDVCKHGADVKDRRHCPMLQPPIRALNQSNGRRALAEIGGKDVSYCMSDHAGVACADCIETEDRSFVRIKGYCVACSGVNVKSIVMQLLVYPPPSLKY